MSDALLDILRELARRQSERGGQDNNFPQSVEGDYERNEKTHQLVEWGAPGAASAQSDEQGPSIDRISEIAETLGFHRSAPNSLRYEKTK